MSVRLIALGGPLAGATISLTASEIAIGRDERNDVTLSDPSVSPRHSLLVGTADRVTIRDLDAANPSFVNGLSLRDEPLSDGDQIQIGSSLFVFRCDDREDTPARQVVSVNERPVRALSTITMRREDVFADGLARQDVSVERLSRDLDALVRISAAISSIRGLVALERPLLELIADVIPASRGAIILSGDQPADIVSAIGWSRTSQNGVAVPVSSSLIAGVLRDAVGVLSDEQPIDATSGGSVTRSVLAAPLVALNKVVGALVLEADPEDGPFDEGHLRLLMAIAGVAATAFEHARQVDWLEGTNRRLQAELSLHHNMVGESPQMRDVYRRVARVSPTDATVLITGESGTGKELVARAIHRNSRRAERPFIAINCAAITETLLESELFGHEKGAFTGAVALKKGKLESADGGTLFLDEVGELSLALQAKLLRVLQDGEFDRVGGVKRIHVDFRLVAATNRNLEDAIAHGLFRRDLYYRLNVVSLSIPPLRERRDDIPLLANWFIRRHADKANRRVSGLSADALACLLAYDWQGNVRELENAIEHAVVLGLDEFVLRDDLPDAIAESGHASPADRSSGTRRFHDAIKQAKKDLITRAVEESGGNYNAAARILGLHPNYLHRLIKNLQLKPALKS